MAQSSATDEDCGICLDALTNPVALPCRHKFCSNCLDSWRSRYGRNEEEIGRKCPLCREKIPPSKEMLIQLKFWRDRMNEFEAEGDTTSRLYAECAEELNRLEQEVGDWTEAIDYSGGAEYLLPLSIADAATSLANPNESAVKTNDVQKILDWLGPPPVDTRRINAKDPNDGNAVLILYSMHNSDFLSILLQFGADVNAAVNAVGATLLSLALPPWFYPQARLLLEWGADTTPEFAELAESTTFSLKHQYPELWRGRDGNKILANLLKSELGGRRCELLNLSKRPDLNGKACVVEKYLPERDRYKIIVEGSMEAALVHPTNLKRRDRTPTDCGYYITFNKGKFSRREFASKEECQAYVAEVEAKGLAEQLDQLDVSSSNAKGKSGKKGRKKKRRKGRK